MSLSTVEGNSDVYLRIYFFLSWLVGFGPSVNIHQHHSWVNEIETCGLI